jgi:hypothetical protein
MSRSLIAATSALLLFQFACASSGTPRARVDQFALSRAEIEGAQVSNLYEVVQRLRPRWLDLRGTRSLGLGTGVVVYQNQTYLGGVDVLKQMGRESAERMHYMDGPKASASLPGLGSQHVQGAIIIEARGR